MSQICRNGNIFWQIPAHKIDNSGYLIKHESRCHNYLGLSQHDPCEKTPILKGISTFDFLTKSWQIYQHTKASFLKFILGLFRVYAVDLES